LRKLIAILLCSVFVVGCGQTLKNSWSNFRAYYNTYYNAEKNFNTGLKKVQDQPVKIDPTEPVRVHTAPVQAGNSDFQKAIEKGAKILRKFPTSKWADDALLLIGKSYYYLQEFYPAQQKFEELQNATSSPKMQHHATIWKGRTQLDLKLYRDGVSFLESQLEEYSENWSKAKRAEIETVTGEHYAMLENWEESADYLSQAVVNLQDRELLGRTLFLYGQVLERLERYGEAYYAFSRVSENFPGFEYIYWANFKQADVARKEGNMEIALNIYRQLRKDDKNLERRGELSFEIARTYEMMGQIGRSEKLYKSLLYGNEDLNLRDREADIYYRLGKIYSEQYNDFSIAAAYFDSSSTVSDAPKEINLTEDPQTLADAFGKYSRLQQTIKRADSLLHLGSLSASQLDSAIKRIRAQKRQTLLAERQSDAQNTLANRGVADSDGQSAASSRYGFLNHRNAQLVSRAQAEFRVVWGNRPLIDDWRRMQVVRQSNVSSSGSGQQRSSSSEQGNQQKDSMVQMNLEDIPNTPEQRDKLQVEKANAQYELGNLMFLNLNSPDSARHYFHQVIKNEVHDELRPRAMYSLHELFKTTGNQDSLQFWRQRILEAYPDTRYARRLKKQSGEDPASSTQDSIKQIVQRFQQIKTSDGPNKALELRQLALANRSSDLSSHIHYQAILAYIQRAKSEDSSFAVTADTLKGTAAVADSLLGLSGPAYSGAPWDSVRTVLQEFDTTFTNAKQQKKVAALREILKQPEKETSSSLTTCKDLGISLSVEPGMDQFLSTVTYPDKLKGTSISGQVEYAFTLKADGSIESYELVSQRTSLGIEDAFEKAFEQSLKFNPLQGDNLPEKVKCEVSFPIQH